ncbi:MAG TPA: 23S rRNA pseudouridine(1911/1915/1917) synthase RluD [Gammaproteobacteria bacterium]|nr:23S rRNA pseudouridine(1911/1915/1917) synthase RluD [Gammaproteobacteria bacterium]
MSEQVLKGEVTPELSGRRLDQALAELFGDYSRSRLQKWIKAGRVTLNHKQLRARDKVVVGDRICLRIEDEPLIEAVSQPIELDIQYEDEHLLIINKPAGLVVHPAAGNLDGTMLNGLLHYDSSLQGLPRAGIVHRLDKETSGLLVVARTLKAHKRLVELLQAREIHREYRTIVNGVMISGGSVDEPIGRHPTQRIRMAVVHTGKPARTDYRVLQRFRAHTLLQVKLHSGRTHQIRVHMAHINYPLVGDPLYGGRLKIPAGAGDALKNALRSFRRQALHAFKLGFEHPETGEWMEWECAIPDDMQQLLTELQHDKNTMD